MHDLDRRLGQGRASGGQQECGECLAKGAETVAPNCACVGPVPGSHDDCCGPECGLPQQQTCDWCASNNHPHFDLDVDTFNWVCGDEAIRGSCQLAVARWVECLEPRDDWPPGEGICLAENGVFGWPNGSPDPLHQPQVPDTKCCCNWDLKPQADKTCK